MAKTISKKATTKKTTPKKTSTSNGASNKMSRKDQIDCSNLIMIGTAIVILLVIGYISIEYFMI